MGNRVPAGALSQLRHRSTTNVSFIDTKGVQGIICCCGQWASLLGHSYFMCTYSTHHGTLAACMLNAKPYWVQTSPSPDRKHLVKHANRLLYIYVYTVFFFFLFHYYYGIGRCFVHKTKDYNNVLVILDFLPAFHLSCITIWGDSFSIEIAMPYKYMNHTRSMCDA